MHNQRALADALAADRRADAARRRAPADGAELERLVRAAGAGDEAAWRSLMERFTARIRAVARSHRLMADDTEDIAQTTWLRLVEQIQRVREPEHVGAWLTTTARRESLRVIAAAGREQLTDGELIPEGPAGRTPDAALLEGERRAAVADALDGLPERHARLVRLLFAEPELSYADISTLLDMPVGSIGPIRGRCLEQLRRRGDLRALVEAAE
jgi:RNA polymerase sigma factor (sigma-70 family)